MNTDNQKLLHDLYSEYRDIIKPLIASIEADFQQFPVTILNEIRAFNDHISRCYIPDSSEEDLLENLKKAKGHNKRTILDCYKYLLVYHEDKVKTFEKQTAKIDLTTINNGLFYIEYRKLRQDAVNKVRIAKGKETQKCSAEFDAFQDAYDIYLELDKLIDSNFTNVHWARAKFYVNKVIKAVLWLLSTIIAVVSGYILRNSNINNIADVFKLITGQ